MKLYGKVIQISILLVLSLMALCHLSGCDLDCSNNADVRLGEIRFDNPDFLPFKGGEQFTFLNTLGDELVFFDSKIYDKKNIRMGMISLCYNPPFGSSQTFYDTEFNSLSYQSQNDSAFINYLYRIDNESIIPTTDTDTVLFDFINMGLNVIEPDISHTYFINYIVSDRGNTLDPITIANNTFTRIINDTTINGNFYPNLYCPNNRPGFFYSTTYGIVLFYYKDDWWHLKR
ncbi:MAG: hypothetical protein OEW67_11820 [Cyclobacteriaceae bacterium]|nr:hypothetical protein [Cyclobacteriaceae bacterium]